MNVWSLFCSCGNWIERDGGIYLNDWGSDWVKVVVKWKSDIWIGDCRIFGICRIIFCWWIVLVGKIWILFLFEISIVWGVLGEDGGVG